MLRVKASIIALSIISTTVFAMPAPDGVSPKTKPLRESELAEKIAELASEAKDFIGFKSAGFSQTLYRTYADARRVVETDRNEDSREEAVKTIHGLAKQGYPLALNYLGYLMDNGIQVQKDHVGAAKYFYEAASRGDLIGRHNYAVALILGRGVARNEKEGIKLLTENSRRRLGISAVTCGIYYENLKEWARSISCYRAAAGDREHPIARTRIAIFEIRGRVGSSKERFKSAKILLTQAARLWWPEAQWTLADMERYGIGDAPNAFKTAFWLRILKNNPNSVGTKYIEEGGRVLGGINLDEKASISVDKAVEYWMQNNRRNMMSVIDYTKSIPDTLRD